MNKAVLLLFSLTLMVSGCASARQFGKALAGVSTKELESVRSQGVSRDFNCDYFTAYEKVLEALKKPLGAQGEKNQEQDAGRFYIYEKVVARHLIAGYVSETDTTPVGIFFDEIDKNNTRITVASESTFARDFVAENLFERIKTETKKVEVTEQ